jgi:hypothetical protein
LVTPNDNAYDACGWRLSDSERLIGITRIETGISAVAPFHAICSRRVCKRWCDRRRNYCGTLNIEEVRVSRIFSRRAVDSLAKAYGAPRYTLSGLSSHGGPDEDSCRAVGTRRVRTSSSSLIKRERLQTGRAWLRIYYDWNTRRRITDRVRAITCIVCGHGIASARQNCGHGRYRAVRERECTCLQSSTGQQ